MTDAFPLSRFVEAQEPVFAEVVAELSAGRKTSHWMWFVFPQIEGLGHSSTARHYAIKSLDEAKAYLQHPVLGPRLRECTRLVNAVRSRTAAEIFGYPDDLKFRSSMTLFAHATAENEEFLDALRRYYGGEFDAATLQLLRL
jgi:uncharacterized protein (DUF1810 family)